MTTNNFIRLSDSEYPISFTKMRNDLGVMLPRDPSDEILAEFGYANVYRTERPSGHNVQEVEPVMNVSTGKWEQAYQVSEPTAEELQQQFEQRRQQLVYEIRRVRSETLNKGFKFVFPNEVEEHIQLRDGDRANLAGLDAKAQKLVNDAVTDPVFNFRTYENSVHALTPEQMLEVTDAAFEGYMGIMGASWTLENQALEATSDEELPQVPQVLGQD